MKLFVVSVETNIYKEKKKASTFHPFTCDSLLSQLKGFTLKFERRINVGLNGKYVSVCWREAKSKLRNKCIVISNWINQFIAVLLI